MHSLAVDIGGTKIAVGLVMKTMSSYASGRLQHQKKPELIDEHIANLYLEASKSFRRHCCHWNFCSR